MVTSHIGESEADGVMTLVLDRPEKKNALTDAMYGALADAIERAGGDASVRVVVLRGEGDMFTAGNDIGDFAAAAPGSAPVNVVRFLRAIAAFEKPLVAAVNGRAVGVGSTMLLHCDYVLLADDAILSAPFVDLALVPEAGASLLLPARVGFLRAFAIMALGETVDAESALRWGLASSVVPARELPSATKAVAARLTSKPPGAIQATKRLMRDTSATSAQMELEFDEFSARLQSAEAKEAFLAFAEKRAPDFTRFS